MKEIKHRLPEPAMWKRTEESTSDSGQKFPAFFAVPCACGHELRGTLQEVKKSYLVHCSNVGGRFEQLPRILR